MSFRFALSAFVAASLSATAALADEPLVVKVGTVAPDGTPWSELIKKMKRDFGKAFAESDQKLKFKSYLGGRLGGEKEMVRETREGRLQMYGGSVSSLATVIPELYILESPFLLDSDEEADFVLERVRPEVERLLEQRGFIFYQWAENGWQGLAMKGPCLKEMGDLSGKKVRSQEAAVHLETFKALGANPVEMAVPEVLPALKQGVVDGFSNTPLFAFATSWYQGVESFTVTDHIYQPGVIVYSKKWFDGLPKPTQEKLLINAREYEKFGRTGVRAIRDGLLKNFEREKIEVCTISSALKAEMKKKTAPVYARYRDKPSRAGKPLAQALVAAKKAWDAR